MTSMKKSISRLPASTLGVAQKVLAAPADSRFRSGLVTIGALVALASATALGQVNLLRNPSFEDTPSVCSNAQGILPNEWLQSGNIVPAADTWNDGETDSCYGVLPGAFSRWIGVTAADGDHWAAGAEFGPGGSHESIGQLLSSPLSAGTTYQLTGSVLGGDAANLGVPGGYQVWLSMGQSLSSSAAIQVGTFAATNDPDNWLARSIEFEAPANAADYPYLVFKPFTASSGTAYIGLDDLMLSASANDTDEDGVSDESDNCPNDYNPDQGDFPDGDGVGDVCDVDDDNDGVFDVDDNCPIDPNPLQEDFDGDGMGNACDPTFDGDAVIAQIESVILCMRGIIVDADPPGGNGMIAKLTGNGGVLAKVGNAVTAYENGLIDVDTYIDGLNDAIDKLAAFDNQLSAKAGNGQILASEADELAQKSAEIRVLIEALLSAVGG